MSKGTIILLGFFTSILLLFNDNRHPGMVSPLSPEQVMKLVGQHKLNGLKRVWGKLGVNSRRFEYVTPDRVERFDEEIDGREGPETIIKVSNYSRAEGQFLVFSKRREEWFFLGKLDYTHFAPGYSIVSMGPEYYTGKRKGPGWLAINDYSWGTGLSLHSEHWWDLSGDSLKEVLKYPEGGHVTGWGMLFDRKFGSQILGYDRYPTDEFRVHMLFWAIYYNGLDEGTRYPDDALFSIAKKVTYVWDSKERRFVIDPRFSQMTQEQIDGLFQDASYDFLKHNYEEIRKLASSKEESKREWLKHFLENVSDVPEKTALLNLLR